MICLQKVGCQVPWETKRDVNDDLCTTSEQIKYKVRKNCRHFFSTFSFSRTYISTNDALKGKTKTELTDYTNCLPPCHFWRYTQKGDPHVRSQLKFGKSFKKFKTTNLNTVCPKKSFFLDGHSLWL